MNSIHFKDVMIASDIIKDEKFLIIKFGDEPEDWIRRRWTDDDDGIQVMLWLEDICFYLEDKIVS